MAWKAPGKVLKDKCVNKFHHHRLIKEPWCYRNCSSPLNSSVIIKDQIDIISFLWVISQPEVGNNLLIRVYILAHHACR